MRRVILVLATLAITGCGSGSTKTVTVTGQPVSAGGGRAGDIQQRFVEVVRRVSPAVVQIETSQGLGSGVVFDAQGDIVTNNHVVGSSRSFTVTLAGGDRHPASLVGAFPANDLAVIRLRSGSAPAAKFGDSSKLAVGEFALAIGNPLGLRSSVTQGIVSSLGRTVSEGNGAVISSAVQTSAPINPGNSGGALVDIDGRVIGIPTLAAVDPELGGTAAPGIGFAIPSNMVKNVAPQLIRNGRVSSSGRAYLGVEVASLMSGGAVIAGVLRGGPAAKAGLRPGDVITSVGGMPVTTSDELTTILAGLKPGQTVAVAIRRGGAQRTLRVKLGEAPG